MIPLDIRTLYPMNFVHINSADCFGITTKVLCIVGPAGLGEALRALLVGRPVGNSCRSSNISNSHRIPRNSVNPWTQIIFHFHLPLTCEYLVMPGR